MKFRTTIEIDKKLDLKPDFKLVTLGSCFADRIGSYFSSLGTQTHLNPYGVIYNPQSITNLLKATLDNSLIGEWEKLDEMWVNPMYHGQFSGVDKKVVQENIAELTNETGSFLREADLLVITLGTSYGYRDNLSGEIVTNCHRLPSSRFSRELLSVEEMQKNLKSELLETLEMNPKLRVVLTVSPVRHVRDSLIKNQLSKSQLVCLVHGLVEEMENVLYFPSYEILMDDLRDYRFYDEGLVQPNSQALTYIQEKFREFAYSDELISYEKLAEKLGKKLSHKPINLNSQTERFNEELKVDLKGFLKKYPFSKLKL